MFNGIRQFGSQGAAIAKLAILQKKIQNHKTEVEENEVKAFCRWREHEQGRQGD
jgi:hypothetical protein